MSVKERVKAFCSYSNMTIKDFEISINASNGYVNSISKGIGEDKLSLIIEKYPNLNIGWLLTGLGTMINKADNINTGIIQTGNSGNTSASMESRSSEDQPKECQICKEKDKRIEDLKEQIASLKEQLNILQLLIQSR